MYQKQIEQLVVLQQLDKEIEALEKELELAPREVKALEDDHKAASTAREAVQEKIDHLRAQQRRISGEIDDDSVRIKKSKNKLMMASNTREYHAMMREMDNMEKSNRLREEENIALNEELERQEQAMTGCNSEVERIEGELEVMRKSLAERVEGAQKELDALHSKREKAGEIIPKPILARYEFIRSRLSNPVIVAVEDGVCHGCNITIPPQTYNELQRGKQIHSCPNCNRLIYWEMHLPSPAKKEEAAAEA